MRKKDKVSVIINILIFIFVTIATIFMFTGFKFMHGIEPVLESTKLGMLKFFTVQSNMFMGLVALLFALKKILKQKITRLDHILNLMSTTAVSLTFVVVFAYLGPISKGGISSMLQNSNLFFHLIVPVLSIINYILFEKVDKMTFKDSIYGIVPALLYSVYYITNIIIHMENGKVSPIYDWYWFIQNGVWTAFIVGPLLILITYIITLILLKLNKKFSIK